MFGDPDNDPPTLPPDNDDDGDDNTPVPDETPSTPPTEPPTAAPAPDPAPHLPHELPNLQSDLAPSLLGPGNCQTGRERAHLMSDYSEPNSNDPYKILQEALKQTITKAMKKNESARMNEAPTPQEPNSFREAWDHPDPQQREKWREAI